jgi:hypothetical protein
MNIRHLMILLFVAIVSNNVLAQDTTIRTEAYQMMSYDSIENKYTPFNKKSYQTIDILFTKDSIIVGDYFNSVYKVIENIGEKNTEQGKERYFICQDPEGIRCIVAIAEKGNGYPYPYVLFHYSDVAFVYYTK